MKKPWNDDADFYDLKVRNKIEIVPYHKRLIALMGGFNYFYFFASVFNFIIGSWIVGIFVLLILLVSLYLSYKNARYYVYEINSFENDTIEIHFLDKTTEKKLNLKKKNLKLDLEDYGAGNHLRFYDNSELLLKQYIIGYWTRENLSKFYANYRKGIFGFEKIRKWDLMK